MAVLCISNYARARRAMECQRQRRLSRLSGDSGGYYNNSPHSSSAGGTHDDQQEMMAKTPLLPRRRQIDDGLDSGDDRPVVSLLSV